MRKSDDAAASYAVVDTEARVVRQVYEHYTMTGWSIGAITRQPDQLAPVVIHQLMCGAGVDQQLDERDGEDAIRIPVDKTLELEIDDVLFRTPRT
jgi:hypothetical protein